MIKNEGKTNMDDTAIGFLRTRILFDLDILTRSNKTSKSSARRRADNVLYHHLSDFLDMLDEAQIDFERYVRYQYRGRAHARSSRSAILLSDKNRLLELAADLG